MLGESKVLDRCPIQGIIDVISKKWALLIVAVLGNATAMRYTDILRELRGISPKTLADTLKELQNARIVSRRAFNEIPPKVEYALTKDGNKLREAVLPLINWSVERSNHKDCIILQSLTKRR